MSRIAGAADHAAIFVAGCCAGEGFNPLAISHVANVSSQRMIGISSSWPGSKPRVGSPTPSAKPVARVAHANTPYPDSHRGDEPRPVEREVEDRGGDEVREGREPCGPELLREGGVVVLPVHRALAHRPRSHRY